MEAARMRPTRGLDSLARVHGRSKIKADRDLGKPALLVRGQVDHPRLGPRDRTKRQAPQTLRAAVVLDWDII